ncbi:MAG: hypothetical protein ABJC74_11580 [Gemmatimonadota bacterium]
MHSACRALFIPVIAVSPLAAQTSPDSIAKAGDLAWSRQEWSRVAAIYTPLIAGVAKAPRPRFRLGTALINLGRRDEGIRLLRESESQGAPASQVAFRLAEAHAAGGARDSAFTELDRAVKAGLVTPPVPVDSDALLAGIRQDPRFADFLLAMDHAARPCLYDAHHKEFDFWLGDWDVRVAGQPDSPPAHNLITKIQDGCVVLETWTGATTGQSFNSFDPTFGKWNQTWVDNQSGLHIYWGNLSSGVMKMEGDVGATPPATGRVHTRVSWTPIGPDTVRHFSESTVDEGKTWTPNFDLIYTRRR